MEKILIGKYVNTHGIKGEIRIKSNFKYKEKVFIPKMKLLISNQEFIIKTYRLHKGYDMVTFEGINNINDILPLKGSKVFCLKESLSLSKDEYLDSDLINFQVLFKNQIIGNLIEIRYITNNKKILVVDKHLIPFELIKKIDFLKKIIEIEEVDGLI